MRRLTYSFIKKILVISNIGVICGYLLACLVPYINTETHWYAALLALVFPVILFVLIVFLIVWIILRSKWWISSAIALLFGFKLITATFAFHFPREFSAEKTANTLRIMQWNVSNWDNDGDEISYRNAMFDLIEKENADIMCFEEFYEPLRKKRKHSNISDLKNMGYPYYYFIPSGKKQKSYASGIAIFSRYPIADTTYFPLEEDYEGENLLQADVRVNNKTIRVFATHLQSVRFVEQDYENLSRLKRAKKTNPKKYKRLAAKLKHGYKLRYAQARLVKENIAASPHPVIICGDFNDVPSSSTYFLIKGDLQDTFLKRGSFIGRTFRFISPTLRIDYILADKSFKVEQYKRLLVPYSDHYGVVTDLQL